MKLNKFWIVFFISVSYFFMACEKADEPEQPGTDDSEYACSITQEEYQDAIRETEAIRPLLRGGQGNIDQILSKLKSLANVSSVHCQQGTTEIYVTLSSGRQLLIDGNTAVNREPIDEEYFNKQDFMIDSIDALFQPAEKGPESIVSKSIPETKTAFSDQISRAGRSNKQQVYLKQRNILLVSIDPEFRQEDSIWMSRTLQKVNKISKVGPFSYAMHSIESYSPRFFANVLPKYDIVYISCHGSEKGKMFFPFSGMTEKQKMFYVNLSNNPESTGVFLGFEPEDLKIGNTDLEYSTGVFLGEQFFIDNFGQLNKSLVWTSKCYADKVLGELRSVCLKKNALDYFGSSSKCTGGAVAKIFDSYLAYMAKGVESNNAFFMADPSNEYLKPVSRGFYALNNYNTSKYPLPEATGVKSPKQRSVIGASPVVVGARFRYSTDDNGNPVTPSSGGIMLYDHTNSSSKTIQLTTENSEIKSTHKVGQNFVINEFDVTLTGLTAGHSYSYAVYAGEGEELTVSEQSYSFEGTDEVLYIYTAEDFLEFNSALTKYQPSRMYDIDVELMADIYLEDFLTIEQTLDYFPTIPEEFYYNGHFNGNNHTISYNASSISGNNSIGFYGQSIIPNIGKNGIVENLKVEITQREESQRWHHSVFPESYGTIRDCEFSIIGSDFNNMVDSRNGVVGQNIGIVERCRVFQKGGMFYPMTLVVDNVLPDEYYYLSKRMIPELEKVPVVRQCSAIADNVYTISAVGIVRINQALIENCEVSGDYHQCENIPSITQVHCKGISSGLISFQNETTGIVRNCRADAVIEGYDINYFYDLGYCCAGLVKYNHGLVSDCIFNGSIDIKNTRNEYTHINCSSGLEPSSYAGAAAGIAYWSGGIIKNCKAYGNIVSNSTWSGGIVAYNEGYVAGCANYMSLKWQDSTDLTKDWRSLLGYDLHREHRACIYIGQIHGYNSGTILSCIKGGSISYPNSYHVKSD